jgi:5-methyltetrahydropteroyltriglutamate--homocysteine methyltransferase
MLRIVPRDSAGYAGRDEFQEDVTRIQHQVVEELAAAGCQYIQLDAPSYTEYLDAARMEKAREQGIDTDANLAHDIEADNAVVEGIVGQPDGPVVAIHLCRGNYNHPDFLRRGGYDAAAEELFGTLVHDRFLLEFDDERSGGFESLRFVPSGKVVVLGLITTKSAEPEDPDAIKRRIHEAATYLPLEQLALSPQCGFSTAVRPSAVGDPRTPRTVRMTADEQWRKLELVRQIAADVWG